MPRTNEDKLATRQTRRRHRWAQRAAVWEHGGVEARRHVRTVAPGDRSTSIDGPAWDRAWSEVPFRAAAACGRLVKAEQPSGVAVHAGGGDGSTAYYSGLQRCSSVWLCPVCRATITGHRALEVAAVAQAHSGAGGRMSMLTLTMRHHQGDALEDCYRAIRESWRCMQRLRRWKVYQRSMIGHTTTVEVTYGANGWHVHLHLLLLWDPALDADQVSNIEAGMNSWGPDPWAEYLQRATGKRPNHRGWHLQRIEAGGATYVAKIASETARGDYKTSDALNVVTDLMLDGDAQGFALWSEWVGTMKGKRMLVFSDGLRARYLLDEEGLLIRELTDQELVEQEVRGPVVGYVSTDLYRGLCGTAASDGAPAAAHLLDTVEHGGWSDVIEPVAQVLDRLHSESVAAGVTVRVSDHSLDDDPSPRPVRVWTSRASGWQPGQRPSRPDLIGTLRPESQRYRWVQRGPIEWERVPL